MNYPAFHPDRDEEGDAYELATAQYRARLRRIDDEPPSPTAPTARPGGAALSQFVESLKEVDEFFKAKRAR